MDDLRNLWQNQELPEVKISVEQLRMKAAKFQSRIKWRNLREHAACLLVILFFGAMWLKTSDAVPRIAFALIIAGAFYVAWHLHAWGAPRSMPVQIATANSASFYRGELARQRDLLRSVWKWYLAPLLPGMALLIAYAIAKAPKGHRFFPIAYALVAAAFFWFVGAINSRAAQKLNAEIQDLDRDTQPG